jgi:hypothetical protein
MQTNPQERRELIDRYAEGPARLKAALAKVPAEALKWRPAPDRWSIHEVICHCGDAEMVHASRIRYLLAEKDTTLAVFDDDRWAQALDYHARPLAPEMAAIEATRATTAAILRLMSDASWSAAGTHAGNAVYSAEDWLRAVAEHLHVHAREVEENLAAWETSRG